MNISDESSADFLGVDLMRGYCPKCKETRSDKDENSWGFNWIDDTPRCRRCGSVVDIMGTEDDED
jgi:phage FluMu protein Com